MTIKVEGGQKNIGRTKKEEHKFIEKNYEKEIKRGDMGHKKGKVLSESPCPSHLLSWQNKGRQPPKCGALAL